MSSRNLRENNSGCYDPVAAQAIIRIKKKLMMQRNLALSLSICVIWQVLELTDRLCWYIERLVEDGW